MRIQTTNKGLTDLLLSLQGIAAVRWAALRPAPGKRPVGRIPDRTHYERSDLDPSAQAGRSWDPNRHVDGVDLMPLLRNPKTQLSRAALFLHYRTTI